MRPVAASAVTGHIDAQVGEAGHRATDRAAERSGGRRERQAFRIHERRRVRIVIEPTNTSHALSCYLPAVIEYAVMKFRIVSDTATDAVVACLRPLAAARREVAGAAGESAPGPGDGCGCGCCATVTGACAVTGSAAAAVVPPPPETATPVPTATAINGTRTLELREHRLARTWRERAALVARFELARPLVDVLGERGGPRFRGFLLFLSCQPGLHHAV